MKTFIKIQGMHCASCVAPLEKALANVKGVNSVSVNYATEMAEVDADKSVLFEDLKLAVEAFGYKASDFNKFRTTLTTIDPINSKEGLQLALTFVIATPLILDMFLYMAGSPYSFPGLLQWTCATYIQFWAARSLYVSAWEAFKRGTSNMDTLVVLGTSAAYFYSTFIVFGAPGHTYFEASAVVIAFVLLGRLYEHRAKQSAKEAIYALMSHIPQTAFIEKGDKLVEVYLEDLQKGQTIFVKPWETISVDGFILEGRSEVNESMITGESLPVLRIEGDPVIGGTLNGAHLLKIEVGALGPKSRLAQLIDLVEKAQTSRPPIQQQVDKISAVFVPFVLATSALTLLAWLGLGYPLEEGLMAAVSVLVIACPCALGLATPLAVVVSMGSLARQGVIVKDLKSLEALSTVKHMIFDKTGTLTRGEFKILKTTATASLSEEDMLRVAASLQQSSGHNIASAFKTKTPLKVSDFQDHPGLGVEGKIKKTHFALGSGAFMKKLGFKPKATIGAGETVVYLAKTKSSKGLLGYFTLKDTPRSSAAKTIGMLRQRGVKTWMLTGDLKAVATSLQEDLNIDEIRAEQSPKDKMKLIKDLQSQGDPVAMVGDGVNDGPALAQADVGFAMGEGSDVAIGAAPITLMRPQLELIARTHKQSQRTLNIIQQNLFWAFAFNGVGIGVAALGLLNPMFAGLAMAASSAFVVGNSLRLRYKSGK